MTSSPVSKWEIPDEAFVKGWVTIPLETPTHPSTLKPRPKRASQHRIKRRLESSDSDDLKGSEPASGDDEEDNGEGSESDVVIIDDPKGEFQFG